MSHYIDTSVLTAYYCPEPRSARVQRLLARIDGPAISPLVEVELHCAVARKVRAGDLDTSDARRVFDQFRLHLAQPLFRVVALQAADYALARDWIARLASPLRVLDALHLAAAAANGLRLVTADEHLARAARLFGIPFRQVP